MSWFNDLRISRKLALSSAAGLCLTIALGIFAIIQIDKVNSASVELKEKWLPTVQATMAMKANLTMFREQQLLHVLAHEETSWKRYEKRMAEIATADKQVYQQYQQLIGALEEKEMLVQLQQMFAPFVAELPRMLKLSRERSLEEAHALLQDQANRLEKGPYAQLERMNRFSMQGAERAMQRAQSVYSTSKFLVLVTLFGSLVLGIFFAILVGSYISRALNRAVAVAETVAKGDLRTTIPVTSRDETGQLLVAMREMSASLARTVASVRVGTDSIGISSSEIASGNLDLSSRTQVQATAVEHTVIELERITDLVKNTAGSANSAGRQAKDAAMVAMEARGTVDQVFARIQEIKEFSTQISKITAVIDGIAFQTNILALNAAVEAARAGQHGRGFAVVASEVRQLAQRSADAAREISNLISNSVKSVNAGVGMVQIAGQTMEKVTSSIGNVACIIGEIAEESKEQAQAIGRINTGIIEIDNLTQQNAALVEELASASESLKEQALSLSSAVSVFAVEEHVDHGLKVLPVAVTPPLLLTMSPS